MSTKPSKSTTPKTPAKTTQEQSEAPPVETLATTLRTDVGYEYHLDLPRPVVEDLINPETPDVRIEVPCPLAGMRRFLLTSYIKELDVRGL